MTLEEIAAVLGVETLEQTAASLGFDPSEVRAAPLLDPCLILDFRGLQDPENRWKHFKRLSVRPLRKKLNLDPRTGQRRRR